MALRADATLEAFVDRLTKNTEIMNILNLPTILKTDDEKTKAKKRKVLINKVISKSSQEPY